MFRTKKQVHSTFSLSAGPCLCVAVHRTLLHSLFPVPEGLPGVFPRCASTGDSPHLLFVQFHHGRAPMLLQLRPSNEAPLRARVPGAREQCGCPALSLPLWSSLGRCQCVFHALNLDLSNMFLHLGQVIGRLHPQPCLRAASKCFFEADRHFG